MVVQVKKEFLEHNLGRREAVDMGGRSGPPQYATVIDLSSSSSDSDDDDAGGGVPVSAKRARVSGETSGGGFSTRGRVVENVLPVGFLDPLPTGDEPALLQLPAPPPRAASQGAVVPSLKQFWKAGDFEVEIRDGSSNFNTGGMDHVRVHPKFLHSNATSHKWALGAFAELLDNALDEVCSGATYVNMDMLVNSKNRDPMLLIEDNGGGMDPDKMRQCMSLGYSAKSKIANTIGQYGNGFKTSTMRLGADVIVFSRSPGKDGKRHTQSIGLLSYTFLRSTGKEDIVVPILDYELRGGKWEKMIRSSAEDWNRNVDTILQWSSFASEAQLLKQFYMMKDHGTRIIIYNLWEDDEGLLELDFDSDPHDIQIRGANRDEKNIKMAKEFPNSKHFLTYRHSLRSYASILYLRRPANFRIILRGRDVEHHNIVNDMMMSQEVTYRPQASADGVPRDMSMVAVVTIGFVKDAKAHIDVQGFNVYHKNRLIKPFWRVWNAAGSDGRGVIGVLEANFVEPAHDKQGFERTTVLARLETKLINMQKNFWCSNCHKIGYAARRNKEYLQSADAELSPEHTPNRAKRKVSELDTSYSPSSYKQRDRDSSKDQHVHGKVTPNNNQNVGGKATSNKDQHVHGKVTSKTRFSSRSSPEEAPSPSVSTSSEDDSGADLSERRKGSANPSRSSVKHGPKVVSDTPVPPTRSSVKHGPKVVSDTPVPPSASPLGHKSAGKSNGTCTNSVSEEAFRGDNIPSEPHSRVLQQLKEENQQLKERIKKREEEILGELVRDLQEEKDKRISLENKLQEAQRKIEELDKEQETLIDIFSEERDRRDLEETKLKKELKEKSTTIQELLKKVRLLETAGKTNT